MYSGIIVIQLINYKKISLFSQDSTGTSSIPWITGAIRVAVSSYVCGKSILEVCLYFLYTDAEAWKQLQKSQN